MTAADRPTAPHPDLDALADLDAGLLDAPTAGRLTAHIAGCARCTRAVAALGTVRADLAALPTPPVPGPVAARLDATLAGLRHNDSQALRPGPPSGSPGPDRPDGRDGRRPGAGPGGTAGSGGPDRLAGADGAPAEARGGARGGRPEGEGQPAADLGAARERRRRRSLRITGGAVAASLALIAAGASVTALVRDAGDDSGGSGTTAAGANVESERAAASPPPGTSAAVPMDAAGLPSYTRDTLRGSLSTIERESAVDVVTGRGEAGPADVMADAARRQACEQSIIGREGVLRAVRRISYDGKPAYVFVFDDSGTLRAYVVTDQCGIGGLSPVIDRVP